MPVDQVAAPAPGPARLPLAALHISPFNVRTNEEDAQATAALEASILARGLLLPLVVHPLADHTGHFGVLAGGRRLRALRRLVDRGDIPADLEVDVVVRDLPEAEIIELSLAENLLRRELRPYEVYAAIARAVERGSTIAQIADHFGQEERWVRRNLRLGRLHPDIFAAYAAGAIGTEEAQAYAATEDQALQWQVWQAISALPAHQQRPSVIRQHLCVGDARHAALLAFVGADAYRAAGGRFELDLFHDGPDERGRIVDPARLEELADGALAGIRARLRDRAGGTLAFIPAPPRAAWGPDLSLMLPADRTPDHAGDGPIALPDQWVRCCVRIDTDGSVSVSWWYESRRAKAMAERARRGDAPPAAPAGSPDAGAAIGQLVAPGAAIDHGAQAARLADGAIAAGNAVDGHAIAALRDARRAVMRAALIDDTLTGGDIGIDWLVWSLLRAELRGDRPSATGLTALGPKDGAEMAGDDDTGAHGARRVWADALVEIGRLPAFTLDDPVQALCAWQREPRSIKRRAGALLCGMALVRSLGADGWRCAVHDAVAHQLGLDDPAAVRDYWSPPPPLVARHGLGWRQDLLRQLDRTEGVPALAGARQVTARLEALLAAKDGSPGALWVHPLLAWTAPGSPAGDGPAGDGPGGDDGDGRHAAIDIAEPAA